MAKLSELRAYGPVVVVRSFEALGIVSPKERRSGNTNRYAEPGVRSATETRGMEFVTRSVKFIGNVGNCKPSPVLG